MLDLTQHAPGRFLGVVRLDIGGKTFTLPVQAVQFERDQEPQGGGAGGFFSAKSGELGILVEEGSDAEITAQIERACADAVTHLSRKHLS